MTGEELTAWIRELERTHRLYSFYNSAAWKRVKREVMAESHWECAVCRSHGRYTRAVEAHHINHVRVRPDLGLSKTYIDHEGNEQPNLIALCHGCHDKMHGRFDGYNRSRGFHNKERW